MKLIDVGCFNGDSPLHFIAYPQVKEIQAYDPNPRFKDLWGAISERYPQITFHNKAVTDRSGEIEYTLRPDELPLGSTTNSDKGDWGKGRVSKVECVDIAELIDGEFWLKLDAEGEEFNILERLIETDKLKHLSTLWLEWHTTKLAGDYSPRQHRIEQELENNNVQVRNW